jgi:putative aldouronate transport system permease protein
MMKRTESTMLRFTQIKPLTNILFHLVMMVLVAACLIPLFLVVSISFSAEGSIQKYGYQFLPDISSAEGYAYLFKERETILRTV